MLDAISHWNSNRSMTAGRVDYQFSWTTSIYARQAHVQSMGCISIESGHGKMLCAAEISSYANTATGSCNVGCQVSRICTCHGECSPSASPLEQQQLKLSKFTLLFLQEINWFLSKMLKPECQPCLCPAT